MEHKQASDPESVALHPTVEERHARGRAVRSKVPRSAHAEWEPASDRRDPVDLLEEQAATRVPELVPLRYGRMLVSPFTFYRGAAYLMASDLAGLPRTDSTPSSAAMHISRTSERSPRPTGRWSSTATTSTRPSPARSSGT